MSGHLQKEREVMLDWLRADDREPSFLAGDTAAVLELRHAEITQRFLKWAQAAGFAYEVIEVRGDGGTSYVIHWTHRGSSFVGFKQAPPESKVEDALLAGCAALLENQWCLEWLDK